MNTYSYLEPQLVMPKPPPKLLDGNEPVITIAVPVYNPPKEAFPFVMKSLIAFAERYPAVEIILHDDASPDPAVVPVLKAWQAKYPQWIKLQLSSVNQGIHRARQAMVDAAAGRYFLSNDNDDLLVLFDAESEVAFLDSHPEVSATYPRRHLYRPENLELLPPTAFPSSDFIGLCTMMQSTNGALIRTSMLRACGGYAGYDDVEDDLGLFYKLILQGPTILRPGVRVLVRCHEERGWVRGTPESRRAMVAKLMAPYEKEVELLLKGEIPDIQPRLAAALTGGLILQQKLSGEMTLTLCQKLLPLCSNDFGVWGVSLEWLASGQIWEVFDRLAEQAVSFFRSDPLKLVGMLTLLNYARPRFGQMFGQEIRMAENYYNIIPAGLPETLKEMLR